MIPNKKPHLLVSPTGLVAIKLVASTGEQAGSILLFAAAPITLLTALSKSSLGKQVQEALNEKLPVLEAEAQALKQQHTGGVWWLLVWCGVGEGKGGVGVERGSAVSAVKQLVVALKLI